MYIPVQFKTVTHNAYIEYTVQGRIQGARRAVPPWTFKGEGRMKKLSRMHIHPNWIGAVRDSEVKQLFLNAKPRRVEFEKKTDFLKFGFNLLFSLHRRFVIFLFITN